MIKLYYQNECSIVKTLRALRPFYGRRGGPSKSTIQRLVAKFEATGSVNDQPTRVRTRNARSAENITTVRESVQENPRQSIHRRAQELGLSQTSTWRILRRDLGLHPYKIQLAQELKVNDHRQRTMDILHERFEGMVISRRGDVNWPPRSCDLTPLDYFLWGYLKSQVYANRPQSTNALKDNITKTIAEIQPDLCGRVIENWSTRINAIVRSRGGHLNDVIFHT